MIKRNGSVTLDGESLRRSFRRSLRKQESKLSRQVSSAPSETISWTEEDEVSLSELFSLCGVYYSISVTGRPVHEIIIKCKLLISKVINFYTGEKKLRFPTDGKCKFEQFYIAMHNSSAGNVETEAASTSLEKSDGSQCS